MIAEEEKGYSPAISAVLGALPSRLAREIRSMGEKMLSSLSEIRVRSSGRSIAVVGGRNLPLVAELSYGELADVLYRLCRGSLYAYRDSLARGFLPFDFGVRVGVVGEARYDGGALIGVDRVCALVFRIPTGRCDFGEKLYSLWRGLGGGNMLIAAPPSGGKTTALRSLAARIGGGNTPMRVTVIDERCEFVPEDYRGLSVDILRGYIRGLGMEIAIRSLSPEVIMVDEIGTRADADATANAASAGITVIATAHASGLEDARRRPILREIFELGLFPAFAAIRKERGGFAVEVWRI